ncbi:MAG TPA: RNA helicase [Actinobacteria bacterium]|nr:RNA helicase [Actinomycetota bacterium]
MTQTNTPESSASSFAELGVSPDLVAALAQRGITEPFPVQTLTIPDALAGRDVCGKAQTGSGKTLAFGLPLIERTAHADQKDPHGLVVVPTRELCVQVSEALRPLGESRGLTLASVYGGAAMGPQIAQLRSGVDLLVATPGRLIDLIDRKAVDVTGVASVVLDEADQMADMGFLPQVHQIMRRIGGKPQVMLFSATLDGAVQGLINRYLHDPVRHEVASVGDLVDTQTHRFLAVHHMDKPKVAARIVRSVKRTLIFVSTRHGADRVAEDLRREGVDALPIHGDLRQSDREQRLNDFTDGRLPALVATNLAARGLDIPDVDVVLHYEPPQDYKDFVHRSGRTARAGESGLVVTLVEWDEVEEVQRLQKASGLTYEIVKMFSNDLRLDDLVAHEPDMVTLRRTSDVELSRRFRSGGRRRR